MKSLGLYLLQMIAASGILYGYYHLFLRNKKFHQYNRYYLLSATVIAIIIPFLKIPFYFTENEEATSSILKTLKTVYYSSGENVVVTSSGNSFNWNFILYIIYAIVASVLLTRILISVLKVNRIIRTNQAEELDGIHFVNTSEPGTPFSFFRWLFWNKDIELQSEKGQQIFRHEIFHIQQKHSWDVLFIEFATMIFWINPFFHIIKKEIRAIHEFLADEFATKEKDKWEYAELLLMQVLQTNHKLVTPFFHNQIKRRIAMITNSQKPSYRYLRKLVALPLTVFVVMLFAFTYKNKSNNLTGLNPVTITGIQNVSPDNRSLTDTLPPVNVFKGIRLKGADSTQPPIIIIDGIVQKDSDLKNINADTIESMTVLKDASAMALYGKEGKNGVIIITTKNAAPAKTQEVPLKLFDVYNHIVPVEGFAIKDSIGKYYGEANKIYFKYPSGEKIYAYQNEPATIIFDKVEQEASFPGGSNEWRKYLERNLDANTPVKNNAPPGNYTVFVQFVVNTDGSISDVKALTNHGYGMEEEAIKTIKKGPAWIPAIQNGHVVNSFRKQPITFMAIKEDEIPRKDTYLNEVVVVGYGSSKSLYTTLPDNAIPPAFIGGEKEWRKHLERNINANVPIDNGAPPGTYTTFTQFLVKADGTTAEFKSLTNHGYGMEEEALRVIQSAKQWEPAVVNGQKVDAYKKQPITFQITDDVNETTKQTISDIEIPVIEQQPIYPNPSTNNINLVFNSLTVGKGEVRITDINGNLKMTKSLALFKGNNKLDINVSSLAKGTYMVYVKGVGNNSIITYKMIKH